LWTPREAVLRGPLGEVLGTPRVWPRKPIPPGEPLEIVMEMDATELEARGSFTLELLGGEGEPGVSLEGVKFP
ncbi:MAG TPA: DUF2381 family protein, partial [Myxococcaceae bacterium]|nr:DUF2381 family protein [Myxococcaceae bacterium]